MTPPYAGRADEYDESDVRVTKPCLPEVHRSIATPASPGQFCKKLRAFAGPGYLVAVGYMDPGNWATDLAGGSAFGYSLLSVVLISNLLAILLQALAAKLGIVTGLDLAQACRRRYSPPIRVALWLLCEVAIVACDLAEVIGTAIALQLLFGIPLIWGVVITAADVLVVLLLQRYGFRQLEAFVIALLIVVAGCFGLELLMAHPDLAASAAGLVPKREILTNPAMLYIAVGILGATVMPHNLYLHSAIVQTRRFERSDPGKREAIAYATIDSTIALSLALLVNGAILILAAAAFHAHGQTRISGIEDAYQLLTPTVGIGAASTLFAVALLASGQNSTVTATLAGQIVMEGFVNLRLPAWARRLITRSLALVPTVAVTALYGAGGTTQLLLLSQVILSLQLPFAVVPLVMFTNDKVRMGQFANGPLLKSTAAGLTALIVCFNLKLVWDLF